MESMTTATGVAIDVKGSAALPQIAMVCIDGETYPFTLDDLRKLVALAERAIISTKTEV